LPAAILSHRRNQQNRITFFGREIAPTTPLLILQLLRQKVTQSKHQVDVHQGAKPQPLPGNLGPLPVNIKPLPGNIKPLPSNIKQLPRNIKPLPRNRPSLSGNLGPLPANLHPLPGNLHPLPGNLPPLPGNLRPTPGKDNYPPIINCRTSLNLWVKFHRKVNLRYSHQDAVVTRRTRSPSLLFPLPFST